jgi:ketosteroid isomerase-like protein
MTRIPASDARLERVRRIYDAIIARDLDQAMAGSADEIEWRNPAQAVEPGTRRGKTEFAEAVAALLGQFAFERLEILDSAERGDAVALRVRVVATGQASGAPIDTIFGQVFRFAGESVVAFEWSPDPNAALEALGADRWPGGDDPGS